MLAATSDNPEILGHLTQIDKDLLRTFPGGVPLCFYKKMHFHRLCCIE